MYSYPAIPAPASASIDPVISRLRPRSVLEILDQSFRIYRSHFLTFLAIIAVTFLPVQLLIQGFNVYVQGSAQELNTLTASQIESGAMNDYLIGLAVAGGLVIVLALLGGVLMYLSQGALTVAVADSYLDKPVGFGSSYARMLRHLGPLLGLMLLQIVIPLVIFLPVILMFMVAIGVGIGSAGSGSDTGVGAFFGLFCLAFLLIIPITVLYIYINVRLSVAVPALVVESLGPVQSLRRSWGLVQHFWWRTFALVLVLGIMAYVIAAGPTYLVMALVALFTGSFDPVLITAISGLIQVLMSLLFVPLQLIATTLYYFDLRVRKEGFDMETAMNQRYYPPGQYGQKPAHSGGYSYSSAGQMAPPMLGYGGGSPDEQGQPTRYVGSEEPYGPAPARGTSTRQFGSAGPEHSPPREVDMARYNAEQEMVDRLRGGLRGEDSTPGRGAPEPAGDRE